jgi:GntR family transcriptional repressor for pyruvate dehydrogenase complex
LRGVLTENGGALDARESLRLDLEFHLLVAQAADNGLLASLITLTASWTTKTRVLSHDTAAARSRSHAGHCLIFDAISSRDPDAASLAMTCHLDEVNALTRANVARQLRA